jgi:hypothetical protein
MQEGFLHACVISCETTIMFELFLKMTGKRGEWISVKTIREAQVKVREFIIDNRVTGETWQGGKIRIGSIGVAHVSYSGRTWKSLRFYRENNNEIVNDLLDLDCASFLENI